VTAAALLDRAKSAGVALFVKSDGALGCRGPRSTLAQLLPDIRRHKPALLGLLATNGGYSSGGSPECPEAHPAPTDLPPRVAAIINEWLDHIGEHHIEDRADLLGNLVRDPAGLTGILRLAAEAGITAAPDVSVAAQAPVTCGTCEAFERDLIGDGAGLGACRINAPASRRPPALWPNAPHLCSDHEETGP
jgi:hypothetical protein